MKQFLKSALCSVLLVSSTVLDARHSNSDCGRNCNTSCNTNCNTSCNTGTNCNTNCNTGCNTNNFCNTGCNTNCNTSCNTNCNTGSNCNFRCSDDGRRHHGRRSSDCCFPCTSDCGHGYVNFRNQGSNTARHLVGWQTEIDRADVGECYGVGAITYEYTRSFRDRRIAQSLFGTNELLFLGSQVPASTLPGGVRPPNAFVADYFGLPANYQGSVRFCPRIQNHILEFSGYYNFSDCPEGAWFLFHAPVVFTRWDLRPTFCDSLCSATVIPAFPVCTFSTTATVAASTSLGSALTGGFTGVQQCAHFFDSLCRRQKTRLADLELQFGYNFYNDDCGHAGLYLVAFAPTGNKPRNHSLFEPVVGNGGHAELGLGIRAHSILWDDQCDQNLGIWFDGYVTHLFRRRQCRVLDFCGRPFSRFVLLREFQSDGVTPTGRLVSATCFNRRNVDVRINVKGDASVKLAYRWCGFGFDLGYNIYGHSREKIRFHDECAPCDTNGQFAYGIAGTSGVCCTTYPTTPGVVGDPCPEISGEATGTSSINATFSNAGVFTPTTGTNPDNPTFVQCSATSVCLNAGTVAPIGAIVPCFSSTGVATTCQTPDAGQAVIPASAIAPSSSRPVLVGTSNLDPRSAQACAVLTHKVFGHLSYTWCDDCGYNPQIGVGGEVEFEKSCERRTLNQWGVWVKLVGSF